MDKQELIALAGWQPIETAPSGPFLGWCFGEEALPCYPFTTRDGELIYFDYNDEYQLHPTHWMPLPAPPTRAIASQEGE